MASITRSNQTSGATRRYAIQQSLEDAIRATAREVYGPNVRVDIYSGGQDEAGRAKLRSSHRHNIDKEGFGKAADVNIYVDGKQVRGAELAKMGQQWGLKYGGGIGLEMKKGGIHLDMQGDNWDYDNPKHKGIYTPEQRELIGYGLYGRDYRQKPNWNGVAAKGYEVTYDPTTGKFSVDTSKLVGPVKGQMPFGPMLSTDELRAQALLANGMQYGAPSLDPTAPANPRSVTTARQPADLFDRINASTLRPPADVPGVPQDSMVRAYDGTAAPVAAPVGPVASSPLTRTASGAQPPRNFAQPQPSAATQKLRAITQGAKPPGNFAQDKRLTDPTGGQLRFGAITGIPSDGMGTDLGTPGQAASIFGGSSGDPIRDEMNARRENARVQAMARQVAPQVQSAVSGLAEALRPNAPQAPVGAVTSRPLGSVPGTPTRPDAQNAIDRASPATQKLRAITQNVPAGSAAGAAMGTFGSNAAPARVSQTVPQGSAAGAAMGSFGAPVATAPARVSQTNRTGVAAARGGATQAVQGMTPGRVTQAGQKLANDIQTKTIAAPSPLPSYSVPRQAPMGAAMGSFGAPAFNFAPTVAQSQAATLATDKATVKTPAPASLADLTQAPMEPGAAALGNPKPKGVTASQRIQAALSGAGIGGTVAGPLGALVGAGIGAATAGGLGNIGKSPSYTIDAQGRLNYGNYGTGGKDVYRNSVGGTIRGGNQGGGVTGYTPSGAQMQGGGGIGDWSGGWGGGGSSSSSKSSSSKSSSKK